jgi:S1-C subfamily serine protease
MFDRQGHVITDARRGDVKGLDVTTYSGKRLKATLVGRFAADDLAVNRIANARLMPATFCDS